MYKNDDDNEIRYGEMEPENHTEKSALEGGLWALYTEKWMVRQITEDDPLRVRTHLRQWINEKRHLEIEEGLIQHLKGLPVSNRPRLDLAVYNR